MQPNVVENADFSYANKDALLRKYLALSDRATSDERGGLADVTHLIWPESPFPFILSRDPDALDAIAAALPRDGVLVTGAARMEGKAGSSTDPARYFNAIEVVAKDGAVGDSYDKVHLVPFGEYVPFAALLGRLGVSQFVHIPGGFEAGRGIACCMFRDCRRSCRPSATRPSFPAASSRGPRPASTRAPS